MRQLSRATTRLPIFRAMPISVRVPYSPPTATTESAVRTMMALRACPMSVAMTMST